MPLWAYGLNLGDEVETMDSAQGGIVALRIVETSSNETFRVRFEGARDHDTRWQDLMKDLEAADCWFDVLHPGYVAIAVPCANRDQIEQYLDRRSSAGELAYEHGGT